MEQLANIGAVTVRQRRTVGEAVIGIERKNYYDVEGPRGELLFNAEEVGRDFSVGKAIFQEHRTFQLNVKERGGGIVMRCIRDTNAGELADKLRSGRVPYRTLHVYDARNELIGSVTQRFNLIRAVYDLADPAERVLAQARSFPLIPIRFTIGSGRRPAGVIRKNYRNVLMEFFTKSDTYTIDFHRTADPTRKALILALVFLIDFNMFENSR